MKLFKKTTALFLALGMSMSLAACTSDQSAEGSAENGSNDEVYKIIMGGTVPDEHPISQAQYEFKRVAEELSGGRLEVDVFTNNTIGASRELLETVQAGEIQMCETSQSTYASFTEELISVGLPFLFKNREAAYEFYDSEMGDRISEEIANQTGVRIVGYFENGIRQLTNSEKAIISPQDMQGLKIRVMESPLYINMFELMGANPVPMSFGELYTALQQGTVAGQDNPYAITATNAFYEVQDYMTNLSHSFDITCLSINDDFYQSLPEDLRDIVDQAAEAATKVNREKSIELEETYIATIQEGGTEITFLTDEQRNEFKIATEGSYDFFRQEYNPTITLDEVLAKADEVNATN